jgi:hypothetical protein
MLGIANSMDNFTVDRDPEFDYIRKAEDLFFKANQIRANSATQSANVVPGKFKDPKVNVIKLGDLTYKPKQGIQRDRGKNNGPSRQRRPRGANRDFRAFIQAISGQESGGNYQAVNPDSGAAGKYQIMPANFVNEGGWDRDALGRDISLQFYLNHPKTQERIARNKLREYYNNYGARGAASAWYSGDPNKWRNSSPQGGYPSIAEYVNDIIRRMGY